jgi:hypothetical protein
MLPKKSEGCQNRLFQNRLENIINIEHPLARLSEKIDWRSLEKNSAKPTSRTKGVPGFRPG